MPLIVSVRETTRALSHNGSDKASLLPSRTTPASVYLSPQVAILVSRDSTVEVTCPFGPRGSPLVPPPHILLNLHCLLWDVVLACSQGG